jgi:hypothetical protein
MRVVASGAFLTSGDLISRESGALLSREEESGAEDRAMILSFATFTFLILIVTLS